LPLSAIRDRSAVLQAIDEFDSLGRDRFLEKYGFGPARAYELVFNRRRYDSKAILGAAHGFARPDLGPMTAAEFTGGRNTVMKTLEGLGFEVQIDNQAAEQDSAFLLTWKASGWPHENILRMIDTLKTRGFVDEPWRLRSSRKAKVGDPVWLLKQGPGPKVIFGEGVIAANPTLQDSGNGKRQQMATIRFSRLVDPLAAFIVDEPTTRTILSENQLAAQASGDPISAEQAAAFRRTSGSRPTALIPPGESDDDPFDPTDLEDARDRILREITRRRGQRAFRDGLLRAYEGRCAITDCEVKDVLEAGHIVPYLGPLTNRTDNGLLLRADIHTLFDCGLISIDADTRTVVVADRLLATDYANLNGKALRAPKTAADAPSAQALARRTEMLGGRA
jgi:putative restriction endonuclease